MKIIELRASNVKRLRAVEITPDGTMQVIGGRNAQGKSSVLDAIWLALGGGKASKETPLPIRDGETKASVRLDLGDLIVTRSWTQKGTTLKVENADGAAYSSPQAMLDGLVGQLSFDPLAFTRLSAREQREALLRLVELPVDVDALDTKRQLAYEDRTEIGRQGKALGDVPAIDEDLPKVEQSASEIITQIRAAQEVARHNAEVEQRRQRAAEEIADIEMRIAEWGRKLSDAKEGFRRVNAEWEALVTPADASRLEAELATVEDTNARIRANNAAKEKLAAKTKLRKQYEAATREIEDLDQQKADALAKATFPVDGLGFDEQGVTYNGVPLAQASSAEQIRVSLAMGMALNPKLKVLMIKDGSLLDADSMAAIREQVAERDYQLLIERVGNADKGAVVIEDGAVAS